MSKFHRNKKKKTSAQDNRAIWLLSIAALLVILLFTFM